MASAIAAARLQRSELRFRSATSAGDEMSVLERHLGVRRLRLNLPSLSVADWVGRGLHDEHMKGVALVITGAVKLEELGLARNAIGDEGAAVLAFALPSSGSLRQLWLSGNRVADAGAIAIAEALPKMGARDHQPPPIQELWLATNRIGDDGASALAAALAQLPQLRKVDLRSNRIGDVGCSALAAVMPRLVLDELYLQENRIADVGARALASVLPAATWCHELRLTGNAIADDGAAHLAAALPSAVSLRGLRLSSNQIGDAGGAAIARALLHAPLQRLELAYNVGIADATTSALADALPSSHLLALDLEGHSSKAAGEERLALSLLGAAVFGVPRTTHSPPASDGHGAPLAASSAPSPAALGDATEASEMANRLALRQLHGVRLVSHVRALGVLSDELRDELDNGVLLDELRLRADVELRDSAQKRYHRAIGMTPDERRGVEQLAPTTAIVELRARLEAALAEENRRRDELRQVQEAMAMAAAQAGPDAQVAPAAQAVQAEQVAQTATSDVVAGMEAAAAAYAGQGLAPEGGQDMRLSLAWERLREAEAAAEAAREAIVRRWEQLAVDAHNASPTPRSEAVAEAAAAHGTQDTHRIHPHFPAAHATPAPRPDTAELKYAIQSIFDRWDVDRSGLLSLDEFREGINREALSPQFRDDPTMRVIATAVQASGGLEALYKQDDAFAARNPASPPVVDEVVPRTYSVSTTPLGVTRPPPAARWG